MYNGISVAYPGNHALIISITGIGNALKICTDAKIPDVNKYMINKGRICAGSVYSGGYAATCNEHIQNFKPLSADTRYVCNFLNLQVINNIYITSPNLGSYDTVAPFSNNVIKKSPVTANYGYMIIDQYMSNNDFLDCNNQTLKTLEFRIRDGKGNLINLHGAHVTFSIVFNKYMVSR